MVALYEWQLQTSASTYTLPLIHSLHVSAKIIISEQEIDMLDIRVRCGVQEAQRKGKKKVRRQ
jgi:hypothetical protein